MKKGIAALLAAALLLALAACLPRAGEEEDSLRLWFAIPAEEQMREVRTALGSCAYGGAESVPALLEGLLSGLPADSGLVNPIPPGTRVVSWSVENRVAQVELSEDYGELSGIDLTIADYCITLTLCQLPGVDGVRVTAGEALRDRRVLRAGDVIFSGAEEEPVDVPATLYFRRTGSGTLGSELRVFRLTEDEAPAKAVLEALIAGPQDDGLSTLLPPGVEVRSAWVDDGACHADFTAALLENIPEAPEDQELLISSIVETLCSLDTVERVELLVEGEPLTAYGSLDLSGPLSSG